MKDLPKLLISVIGCELVGFLGTPFTISAIPTWYATLNKPFFAPPNWIFGPVWTLLYFLMGVAFYLIWKQGWQKKKIKTAGMFFLVQLALNFIWSPIFFGLRARGKFGGFRKRNFRTSRIDRQFNKKGRFIASASHLAPRLGLEPRTYSLTARRSAIELSGIFIC